MSMAAVQAMSVPPLFEALRRAGINPDEARAVECAIVETFEQRQNKGEESLLTRVMTKEDGLQMKQEIIKEVNAKIDRINAKIDQNLFWTIGTMVAIAGLLFAAIKLV